jgi:hypothetical protein
VSAVVGQLKVLMSADSAQIVSDLGKARAAARETSSEFGAMGRAGGVFKALTTEIEGVGPAFEGARHATHAAREAMALMGTESSRTVGMLSNAVTGLVASGFTPLGLAIAGATVALSLLAEKKDDVVSAFAATEERVKTLREHLEKLRIELGLVRAGKPSTAADVDVAGAQDELRRRQAVLSHEKEAGFLGREGVGSFWRNVGSSVFPRQGFLPSIDSAAQAAQRAVKEQEEYIRSLKEQQATQTEIEQRRKATEESAKKEAEHQKEIAAAAKAAAEALAKSDALATTRQRTLRDKGVEIETMLHPDLYPDAAVERQKSKVHDAIEDLMKAANAPPEQRRELEERVRFEREMLDLLTRESDVRKQVAAAAAATTKADTMRKETDRALVKLDPNLTDRAKALAENTAAMNDALSSKDLAGLSPDSPERLRLVEEFRRREQAINAEFDAKGVDAERSLVERIGAIRRQAQAATLTEDQNETSVKLAEEDARHARELHSLDEALRKGLVTEEQAAAHRDALAAAHADLRAGIERSGRDKELAWTADYEKKVAALQVEGETDQLRLIRTQTVERIAAIEDETRREVEALRKRGDLSRAQEIENAAAGAKSRVQRQGDLSAAVVGEDAGAGFEARISQLREETAGWGRLGAQMADVATNDLSGGVANALEQIARGSETAGEAFRKFAADFAFQVARMIEQALIMKAILALFPGLGAAGGAAGAAGSAGAGAAASAGAAATGAHGGTWRVGGFGGLDSQLVTMRLSPGEMVRVTDGANSGGGSGDVHVALTVRPPAVIADEVMAKSSPDARAAVVASALRQSGRRGMRARD